jgi:hypothetical protein
MFLPIRCKVCEPAQRGLFGNSGDSRAHCRPLSQNSSLITVLPPFGSMNQIRHRLGIPLMGLEPRAAQPMSVFGRMGDFCIGM